MGFKEKAKDAAKSGTKLAGKAATLLKDHSELKNLTDHGYIHGKSLPKSKAAHYFHINYSAGQLIVYAKKYPLAMEVRIKVATYKIEDLTFESKPPLIIKDSNSKYYTHTLTLATGETFKLDQTVIGEEKTSWRDVKTVFFAFLLQLKDGNSKTKKCINQFFLESGGSAIFDENGYIDYDAFNRNLEL